MKNTKHTPTKKWSIEELRELGFNIQNAEFIVRAVDSHEALLDLVRAFYQELPNDSYKQNVKRVINQAEGK